MERKIVNDIVVDLNAPSESPAFKLTMDLYNQDKNKDMDTPRTKYEGQKKQQQFQI